MLRSIFVAALLASAAPAFAQSSTSSALPDPNDQSNTFTVGLGAGWVPDYEGSDDYKGIPAAFIRGRVSGFNFTTRATWLYVDLIRGSGGMDFDFGPIAGVRMNRS